MKRTNTLYKHYAGPYYGGHDVIGATPVPYYPIKVREQMSKKEVQPLSRVELDDVVFLLVCSDARDYKFNNP